MNYKSNQVLKRINRLQAYKELQNNTIIQFINQVAYKLNPAYSGVKSKIFQDLDKISMKNK